MSKRLVIAGLLWAVLPSIAYAESHRYDITATYDDAKHSIEGVEKITFTNNGATPLSEIYLFLYPNLFLKKDPAINHDFYLRAYPTQFNSGSMEIRAIHDREGRLIPLSDFFGLRTIEEIRLDTPIAPGASFELFIEFVTQIPERFGVFGQFRGRVTLQGGWHPYLPPLINGKWDLHGPPPLSQFHVTLALPTWIDPMASTPLRIMAHETQEQTVVGEAVLPFFSLSFGHRVVRKEAQQEGITLSYIGPEESQVYGEQVLAAAHQAVSFFLSEWGFLPVMEIPLIHAYLYQDLVASGAGLLYVDSRLFKVLPVLKRFHEVRVARSVFTLLLQEILNEEEAWVIETIASLMAGHYSQKQYPEGFDLKSWLRPISFFPFVDQVLYSERVSLRQVYFQETSADRETLLSFHQPSRPGVLGSTRLAKQMGNEKLNRVLADYKASIVAGQHPTFMDLLVHRYPDMARQVAARHNVFPPVDVGIERVESKPVQGGEGHRTTISLTKDHPEKEPVEVLLHEEAGNTIPLLWNGEGDRYATTVVTASPISVVVVDPEEKILDLKRGNNRDPKLWKMLLNRYTLGYDLTTDFLSYGAGLLFQPVHDAAHQVRVDFAHVERMDQGSLQYRWTFHHRHLLAVGLAYRAPQTMFGVVDPAAIGAVFYERRFSAVPFFADALEWLTGDYPNMALAFGYEQRLADSPHDALRTVRLDIRRSFRFAHYHEIGARLFMGFSAGTLFQENRFFLGGEGGLRGYTPLRFEGDDISLLSLEYRFPLVYETDVNLFGLALTHTLQGAFFADAGSVVDRNDTFHRADIKSDIGAGLRWFVDSFGIMPVILRVDAAWPVDSPILEERTLHYYMSAGQPF